MKVLLFTLLLCTAGMSISYQDIAPIISKHCVGCHKGPFLDLQSFPFYSDAIEDQRLLVAEMIRRAKMRDLKRMPPVSFPALSPEEIELLQRWYLEGMDP